MSWIESYDLACRYAYSWMKASCRNRDERETGKRLEILLFSGARLFHKMFEVAESALKNKSHLIIRLLVHFPELQDLCFDFSLDSRSSLQDLYQL